MPPRSAPRRRQALRCSYREGNRQCPHPGAGNPPLCEPHLIAVQEQGVVGPGSPIGSLIADFMAGRRIPQTKFYQAVDQAFGAIFGAQVQQPPPVATPPFTQPPRPRQRRAAPPPPPPAPPDPRELELAARRVLGFTAQQPLTTEIVRKRRAELARKHHPDRGGSTEAMAKINDAADVLLGRTK